MMENQWKTYLEDAGAIIDNNQVQHFGSPKRETQVTQSGNVFADLSHRGLIAVEGEDARTYLQGQLTNDINEITIDKSHLSGFCNAKGRLQAIFHIFQIKDVIYLQCPAELVEDVIMKLQKYVLMSKVTLINSSDTLIRIGICGENSETELGKLIGELPSSPFEVLTENDKTVIRLPGEKPRYELLGYFNDIKSIWEKLDVNAAPVGMHAWELLEIQAGIPTVYPETVDAFVPQMVNLHDLNGISFKKGCYTGQEIVARAQHLGKIKRSMYQCHSDSDEIPKPGTPVYSANQSQSSGEVVAAQPALDAGIEMLVVLKNDDIKNQLHLNSNAGPEIKLRHN